MRLQSLVELKNALPNHFHNLIEHYDLLVHGMSGTHRLLGGRDTEVQMKYQASLLKSIEESHDSGDEDKGENEDEEEYEGEDENEGEMA
jgi:hypothetical protein